MPTYTFHTEETVPHQRDLEITLSVDMGDSSDRLTDRMARTAAENRAIPGITENEKVVAAFSEDGTQVWPRKRKGKTDEAKTFAKNVIAQKNPDLFPEDES